MGFLENASSSVFRKLKPLLAPNLRHSMYEYNDKLEFYINSNSRWLDTGCGHGVFPAWFKDRGASLTRRSAMVVGMDCDWPSIVENRVVHHRVAGDMGACPFRDGAFDLVTANMVVEHVHDPDAIGRSLSRVLQPGGVFIFHTPNLLHYQTLLSAILPQWLKYRLISFIERREEKDVFPTHYRLNTSGAIHAMAARNGFAVVEISYVNSFPELFRLGPLVLVAEMLPIWLSELTPFRRWRSNLVVVLKKQGA